MNDDNDQCVCDQVGMELVNGQCSCTLTCDGVGQRLNQAACACECDAPEFTGPADSCSCEIPEMEIVGEHCQCKSDIALGGACPTDAIRDDTDCQCYCQGELVLNPATNACECPPPKQLVAAGSFNCECPTACQPHALQNSQCECSCDTTNGFTTYSPPNGGPPQCVNATSCANLLSDGFDGFCEIDEYGRCDCSGGSTG